MEKHPGSTAFCHRQRHPPPPRDDPKYEDGPEKTVIACMGGCGLFLCLNGRGLAMNDAEYGVIENTYEITDTDYAANRRSQKVKNRHGSCPVYRRLSSPGSFWSTRPFYLLWTWARIFLITKRFRFPFPCRAMSSKNISESRAL